MTYIKRLIALVVFVAVATATRLIVRYGVEGALDTVLEAVGMQAKADEKAPTKSTKKPKQLVATNPQSAPASPPRIPTPNQNGPALGPSAPLGAGPINAARNAAAASNKQLAEQTGQDAAPAKGGARQNTGAAAPPPASQPAVVQQGTPTSPAATSAANNPGAKTAMKPPPPPAIPIAEVKTPTLASNAKVTAPDTARRPVMRESFDYARDSRRDPFISLMTTSDLRPTITDLRLTGILYDLSGRRPVAILRDVAGGQWRVTTGMTLGRMRVANIKPRVIIFTIEEFGFNRQDSLILGDTTRVRSR